MSVELIMIRTGSTTGPHQMSELVRNRRSLIGLKPSQVNFVEMISATLLVQDPGRPRGMDRSGEL